MWEALAALRGRHPDVRWAPPESLHLTLVFLGPTDQRRVPQIAAALAEVAAGPAPFDVSLGGAGGRIGGRRGGVAWLQVKDGAAAVSRLARQLDERLPGLRAGAINPPHLTVARGVDEAALADLRVNGAGQEVRWTVGQITLFRSHTGPRGATYDQLAAAALGEPGGSVVLDGRHEPA